MEDQPMHRNQVLLSVILAMCGLTIPLGMNYLLKGRPQQREPVTLEEAAERAEQLGLFCLTDSLAGIPSGCIVVSETPLTPERVSDSRMNNPNHPCWAGTVAVYHSWRFMKDNYDPTCSVAWGNCWFTAIRS
jgi:hypothetical protein